VALWWHCTAALLLLFFFFFRASFSSHSVSYVVSLSLFLQHGQYNTNHGKRRWFTILYHPKKGWNAWITHGITYVVFVWRKESQKRMHCGIHGIYCCSPSSIIALCLSLTHLYTHTLFPLPS
jgi:hypothetical protein